LVYKFSVDNVRKVDSFESKQIVGQTVLISYTSREVGEKIIAVKIQVTHRAYIMRNSLLTYYNRTSGQRQTR
jgi:hypothetical protein